MYELDSQITAWINNLSGKLHALDQLIVLTTNYGVPLIVLSVAGQWWVQSNRFHHRHVIVASGLSFLLGLGINQIILLFIQRVRPYDLGITHLLIEKSTDFSFPSDHATATAAIAFAFLSNAMKKEGFVYFIAMLIITFSRIYVGTHYLSDILGGMLIAAVAAAAVKFLYRERSKLDRFITSIL